MPFIGERIHLNLQLFDGNPSKFVKAFVFDAQGAVYTPFPSVTLNHIGNGLYINNDIPFSATTTQMKVSYSVFDDDLYMQPSSLYSDAVDVFDLTAASGSESILVGTIIGESTVVGSIVEPEAVEGSVMGGLIEGDVGQADTALGELVESNDDLVPGSSRDDGILDGEIQC